MQDTVAAQHVAGTRRREHQRCFDGGQVHHRGLGRHAGAHAVAPTRAPEAKQPRCKARQVAGTYCQRPKRIQQPLRCLAQNAWRGERQDVRECERAGVAAARLGRHAFAIDQQYSATLLLQPQCDRHTDDAGADDDHTAR
jgi:hypothetical protein